MGAVKSRPIKIKFPGRRNNTDTPSCNNSNSSDDINPINQLMVAMDENQVDRLQIQHHLFRALWGENFNSPIRDSLRSGDFHVLDVGCGPGTWICDMATDFPSSTFKGIDIVPTFPTQKPTNITFKEANLLGGLPFPDDTFDFVRMSSMILCFTEAEWRTKVMAELLRVLKPGGYLELEDGETDSCSLSPSFERLSTALKAQFASRNMNPLIATKFGEIMESTGYLTDIQHREITVPIGGWGGRLGELMAEIVIRLFEGLREMLIKKMNIRPREFDRILNSFRHEMDVYRTYAKHHRFCAIKTHSGNNSNSSNSSNSNNFNNFSYNSH